MKIIADEKNELFNFYCPGCKMGHQFNNRWTFNGDMEKPTVNPSILVNYVSSPKEWAKNEDGSYKFGTDGRIEGAKDERCHSYIKDGKIQFLDDCTHELKGQTVDLPDF